MAVIECPAGQRYRSLSTCITHDMWVILGRGSGQGWSEVCAPDPAFGAGRLGQADRSIP